MEATRLRWLSLALLLASAVALWDLWEPLLLAAWVAVLARPWQVRLGRLLRGSHAAAAVLTTALLLLILAPLAVEATSLATAGVELVQKLLHSKTGHQALASVVSSDGQPRPRLPVNVGQAVPLIQRYGERALKLLETVAGVALRVLISVFVFVYASYSFLANGERAYAWLLEHVPLEPVHTRRLAAAFVDTGRGLLVSVGLTAVLQAVITTITYLALGVPRPYVLGFLTGVASLVPSIGTALVWLPVAAGLAIIGRWGAALVLAGVGLIGIVLIVDHLVRPVLSRIGRLGLPTYVVLLGMLGGIGVFGVWGLLLGPLLLRLAQEALAIAREERVWRRPEAAVDELGDPPS